MFFEFFAFYLVFGKYTRIESKKLGYDKNKKNTLFALKFGFIQVYNYQYELTLII